MFDGWPADVSGTGSSLLGRICAACVRSVPVTGAAVSLMTGAGHRAIVCASDDVVAQLENLQFDLGEGPCIEAFDQRRPVLAPDLVDHGGEAGARWPAFVPAALTTGARALFAFPLQLGAAELGVLLLYRDQAATLDAAQQVRALRLADAAFFALLESLSGAAAGQNGERDGDSPDADVALSRAEVYQAAGMVMVHLGVSIEEATVRLHAYAFANDRPLLDVAHDIVEHRLRLDDDNGERRSVGRNGHE